MSNGRKKETKPQVPTGKVSTRQMTEEQIASINVCTLAQGLKTAFAGVAMIFDSLCASVVLDDAIDTRMGIIKEASESAAEKHSEAPASQPLTPQQDSAEVGNDTITEDTKTLSDKHQSDKHQHGEEPDAGEESDAGETADAGEESNVSELPTETAATTAPMTASQEVTEVPSLTLDDVTRIIVQKIKQNKDNNEKIGMILKTYGMAKVSDLKSSMFEAFLTDVSAL